MKKFDKALSYFDSACQIAPNNASFYKLKGVAHYFLRKHRLAIVDFNKSIALGMTDSVVFQNRAQAYRELGELKKAAIDYERYLKDYSEDPRSEEFRIFIQKELGRSSRY